MAILEETTTGEEAKQLMLKLQEPKDSFGQVDLFQHLYLFVVMNKTGLQVEGSVTVPAGMKATFVWGDKKKELRAGKQNFNL